MLRRTIGMFVHCGDGFVVFVFAFGELHGETHTCDE